MTTIDVNGLPIAAKMIPGTDPPVVFVAQLGTPGASWQPVINLLGCGATTITYDRPGIGDSPPRPAPNPAVSYGHMATELATLLNTLGITQPVVLVGHSIGAFITRVFAGRHPGRVAGLVHVDGSTTTHIPWPDGGRINLDGDGPHATPFDTTTGRVDVDTAPPVLAPTAVLVRTGDHMPYGEPVEQLWRQAQVDLAQRVGGSVVIADTGHQIPRDAPRLVAFAVDAVVATARSGSGPLKLDKEAAAAAGGTLLVGPVRRDILRTSGAPEEKPTRSATPLNVLQQEYPTSPVPAQGLPQPSTRRGEQGDEDKPTHPHIKPGF